MKQTLLRLLRIRGLIEDHARRDLKAKSAAVQSLEKAAGEQRQIARSMRASLVEGWAAGRVADTEAWPLQIADAEIAGSRAGRLDALTEVAKPAMDQAREELLVRRMERRQAEILRAAAVHAEAKRQVRHDQNRIDDWFPNRSMGRNRGRS
jgi:hypothetical protein